MKILVLTNKLPFEIQTDCKKTSEYFKGKYDIEFVFKEVNIDTSIKQYKSVQGFNPITGKPSPVWYYGLTDGVKDTCRNFYRPDPEHYDIVMFAWNMNSIPQPTDGIITSWTNIKGVYETTEFIQLAVNQYLKNQGNIWLRISHEIMHALCMPLERKGVKVDEMDLTFDGKPFYKNDDPFAVDGNYAQTFSNLKAQTKPVYKYFIESEVVGLKPELILLLDKMRGECGFPFKINSGFRTEAQNNSLSDSVKDSAHLSGLAVDLSCTDSNRRFRLLQVAFNNGIRRIGVGKTFIHIDISNTLPNDVVWDYN